MATWAPRGAHLAR